MKSFGTYTPPEQLGVEFKRLAVPHGNTLPRSPVTGELFFLESEMQNKSSQPSSHRGLYMSTGFGWTPFNDFIAKRRSAVIGSQNFEIVKPTHQANKPTVKSGFKIASVMMKPSNSRAPVSGVASFWASTDQDAFVITSVFRGAVLVGLTADFLFAEKPSTITITFQDCPNSLDEQEYSVRVDTTATDFLFVNQCGKFNYDGFSQTAFIVYENN